MGNTQDVEVGPIWSQSHAEEVASNYIQNHPDYEWTGQWNTIRSGEMSTIELKRRESPAMDADDLVRSSSSHGASYSSSNQENSNQSFLPGLLGAVVLGIGAMEGYRRLTESNNLQSNVPNDDTDSDDDQFSSFHTGQINRQAADVVPNVSNSNTPTSRWQNTTSSGVHVEGQNCTEVSELVAMFPETDEILICEMLDNNNYDVDKTKEDLHQLFPDSSNITQGEASASSNSSLPTPTCPVCYETMKPPRRIFQCNNGHLVCEVCKNQPQLRGCPTCRQPIMGRATAMEQFLADLQTCPQNNN